MSDVIQFPDKSALNGFTYLPMTAIQFEELTNEILSYLNGLSAPERLDPEFAASIVIQAIHSIDKKEGKVRKQELLDRCVNRISCKLTYQIGEGLAESLAKKMGQQAAEVLPDEVTGAVDILPTNAAPAQEEIKCEASPEPVIEP